MRLLLSVVLAIQATAIAATSDPFDLFRPAVVLRAGEREALDRAAPVITLPRARGRELAVFSAIALDADARPDRLSGWMRQIDQLRSNRFVVGSGRFSMPVDPADVEALSLDDVDLDDIKNCKPGRCGVKLSGVEIHDLRQVIVASGSTWPTAVQAAFRDIVLRRVSSYIAGGHAALDEYVDHRVPQSPAAAYSRIAANTVFADRRVAVALGRIAECPAAFLHPDRGYIYWSKERLGGKTVISATHVVNIDPEVGSPLEPLVIGVQIFATHYLDASVAVTAIVRGAEKPYLAHVYRSEVDILDGFWGGLARSVIAGRLKKDGPAILEAARDRLTNVDPPAPPVVRTKSTWK